MLASFLASYWFLHLFSLIFKLDPFEFVKMEVKNDLEQIIAIQLKNIDFQSKLSDKLFILKNNNNE